MASRCMRKRHVSAEWIPDDSESVQEMTHSDVHDAAITTFVNTLDEHIRFDNNNLPVVLDLDSFRNDLVASVARITSVVSAIVRCDHAGRTRVTLRNRYRERMCHMLAQVIRKDNYDFWFVPTQVSWTKCKNHQVRSPVEDAVIEFEIHYQPRSFKRKIAWYRGFIGNGQNSSYSLYLIDRMQ